MARVVRLSARDFDTLWQLVHELHAIVDPEELVHLVLARLPTMISSEITTFDEMRPHEHESRHWVTPEAAVPLRLMPVWAEVMHEHPVLEYMLRTGDTSAHKVSDFVPPPAFRGSRFYNEWYRQIGVSHALNTSIEASLSQGLVVGMGLHRQTKDFSERDRAVLNLLRPHLVQAYQNSLVVSGLMTLLDQRNSGTVAIGRNGRILMATSQARAWLRQYFEWHGSEPTLPTRIERWVERQLQSYGRSGQLPAPREPLSADGPGRRLLVHLLESPAGPVLHLTEERRFIPRETLVVWRLTDREGEVLGWLIEGKTNAEIATILSARPRTIDKHCERIYQKLGVENRTAAVRLVIDSAPGTVRPMRPTHATSPRR